MKGWALSQLSRLWRWMTLGHWLVLAAVLIGIGWRAWFNFGIIPNFFNYEMDNVAHALAAGRGWADTFDKGTGPSAHVMPLAPLFAAATYAMFGEGIAGDILRFIWAMLITFSVYLLAARSFVLAGAPRAAILTGLIAMCLVPLRLRSESFYWQMWDGGLAAAFAFAAMYFVLRAEQSEPGPRPRFAVTTGLLTGLAFVVNPMVGAATGAVLGLHLLRMRDWRRWVRTSIAAGVVMTAVLVPWTIRNQVVMGAPVTLRDNLGLELAAANYPEAVAFTDDKSLWARLQQIHPGQHKGLAAMRAAGGEVAYSRKLMGETVAWIRANPGSVAIIWARHAREMIFTPQWIFRSEGLGRYSGWAAISQPILPILALLALLAAAVWRDRRYLYPATFVAVLVLFALPFQVTDRYSWPVYPVVVLLASDAIGRLVRAGWVAGRKAIAARRNAALAPAS